VEYRQAVADLADRPPSGVADLLGRLSRLVGVGNFVRIDDVGARPGTAVRERLAKRDDEHLFTDVLVALDGRESGWQALEEAIIVARREGGRLRGLHVVADEADIASTEVQALRERFDWRLGEVSLNGQFTVGVGSAGKVTCARARFADLVVASLNYPPVALGPARLSSGYRHLIRNCWRPVLATPGTESPLNRLLLAFDDSPKSREALYVAAYLANQWRVSLGVVHVNEDPEAGQATLAEAERYLQDCAIQATYRLLTGPIASTLIDAVTDDAFDAIVMGGYQASVVSEMVRPTVVDQVLSDTRVPVLICT
jgi:nucleotide-binding universal stress UspA family protein